MSVSGIASSQVKMDYMKLLVTQLQNQNPLEPMDNNEMAAQLTGFSQLEQLESMNSNFASVLKSTERNYAVSLIGKDISFNATNEITGQSYVANGFVRQVYNDVDGKIMLQVGDNVVDMEDVISVKS